MTAYQPESYIRRRFAELLPANDQKQCRFVWMSNFEAERFWMDKSTVQLPKFSQPEEVALVNRLEEMNLFLAEYPDILILREPSDPEFLDYLTGLGYHLPTILTVNPQDPHTAIAEAVLASDEFCDQLRQVSQSGDHLFFLPYAKTKLEDQIIEKTGLGNVGPRAAVCEKLNSKVYSRALSNELGLRTIKGWECESFAALEEAFKNASADIAAGQKFVLKESMGVSGKGLFLADNEQRVRQIVTLLQRKAKTGTSFAFVLEQWIDKLKDVNYQIFISASGEVEMLAIKDLVTENGVHKGHRFPPRLTQAQLDCYEHAGRAIGKRLYEDGYVGVVGIDSIIDQDGEVYPLLEINARFNMSTYQLGLERLIDPSATIIAKHYPLVLKDRLSFSQLVERIGTDLFQRGASGAGVIIQNFATVNVNYVPDGAPFKGRLYVLLVGRDDNQLAQLDQRMIDKLNEFQPNN